MIKLIIITVWLPAAIFTHKFMPGFPLSFDVKIQALFKYFLGPSSCIFKDQFLTEVYSMHSRTAIYNAFCDGGTVIT